MSFSSETKDMLARLIPRKECCQLAELSALVRTAGVLEIGKGHIMHLDVVTRNAAVARKVFKLFKRIFHLHPEVQVRKTLRLWKENIYYLRIMVPLHREGVAKIVGKLKIFRKGWLPTQTISNPLVARVCCQRSYLRGAFLGGGNLSDPEISYHLEINAENKEYLSALRQLVGKTGIEMKIGSFKDRKILYLKDGEEIAKFLRLVGADDALLRFESVRVCKETSNFLNRFVNCETANVNRMVKASLRQVKNIEYLRGILDLRALPPALREVARLRLKCPHLSLGELSGLVDPRISKSGINHRMRRLEMLARALGAQAE